MFAREAQTVRSKPVQVPGRLPDLGGFPRGLEQLPFRQPHENGIQRARLQPGVPADVVSILPVLRDREEKPPEPGEFAAIDAVSFHILYICRVNLSTFSAEVATRYSWDMKRRDFQRDGLKLSYLDQGGEGHVLIALHAHIMEAGTFAPLAAALTRNGG